ncbi:MAG: ABC transporter permease [Anaerolineae bacterium]|jgi:peptide/nickel transport system permease protein
MKDRETSSQELRELYESLPDVGLALEVEPEVDPRTGKSLEAIYGASQWRLIWRKFRRNKAALAGGIVILLFYLSALFAPFLAPYGLTTRFTKQIYMPPQLIHFFDEGRLQPWVYDLQQEFDENLRRTYVVDPEKKTRVLFFAEGEPYKLFGLIPANVHLFQGEDGRPVCILGTDRQGRGMFSRILFGGQVSLTIGLLGVAMSLSIGAVLGIASGYYSGTVDNIIQRVIELIRSFPSIPLWMALSAAIPLAWSVMQTYFAITIILSLIGWTWLARQLRGQVLALRNHDYIMSAKLAGASDRWIIFRHLIPATMGQIVVVSTLAMPAMILAETSLSYLGLGLRPPVTSWGVLIQESQNYQSLALYPWVFTPAIVIAVCILAFSYLGDGLRDSVDPYTV